MTPCQKLLVQEGTARRSESVQQSSATQSLYIYIHRFLGVAEDCCTLSLLLAVPSCTSSFWHGVIPTSYFIFILVSLIFYSGLALTVARGGHAPVQDFRANSQPMEFSLEPKLQRASIRTHTRRAHSCMHACVQAACVIYTEMRGAVGVRA